MALALGSDPDGFIMTVVVSIVAATMGPISIPLMLGLLPWFKRTGPLAAITSWAGGLAVWAYLYWVAEGTSEALTVGAPVLTSLVLYVGIGLIRPESDAARSAIVDSLDSDPTEEERIALERQFLADPDKGGDPRTADASQGDGSGRNDSSDEDTEKPTAAR